MEKKREKKLHGFSKTTNVLQVNHVGRTTCFLIRQDDANAVL